MSDLNKKTSVKTEPILPYIITGVIFIALIAFCIILFVKSSSERKEMFASIIEISPESMTAESRAQDVADWTRDVADNIKPSETRNSFVQTVEKATKDNMIAPDEYTTVLDIYRELRATAYIDDINNSLMKIRGHDGIPTLLDTDTVVELDDNNFIDISEGEADIIQ